MSVLKDKYINPLTDFGFKKLFGSEPNKILLIDFLNQIFQRLFEAAEIAKFSAAEREAYEDSLKYYRDLKNVVDTSREEGILEGIEKGIEQGIEKGIEQGIEKGIKKRNVEIARQMKKKGMSNSDISELTGLTNEEIERL